MTAAFLSFDFGNKLGPKEASIGARLPYARHVDDLTLQTRDGLLVQVIKVEGFPFETADDDELNYRKQVRETLLKSVASSRLAIYHHVVRRPVTPRLSPVETDPFSKALDEAWRSQLEGRRLFVNDLYLTLVSRPLQGRAGFAEQLFRNATASDASLMQDLRRLHSLRDSFAATLAPYGARAAKRQAHAVERGLAVREGEALGQRQLVGQAEHPIQHARRGARRIILHRHQGRELAPSRPCRRDLHGVEAEGQATVRQGLADIAIGRRHAAQLAIEQLGDEGAGLRSLATRIAIPAERPRAIGSQRGGERIPQTCLLYTSPSPRDLSTSRMPSSA